jgi:hypothetical protein
MSCRAKVDKQTTRSKSKRIDGHRIAIQSSPHANQPSIMRAVSGLSDLVE